MTSSYPGFFAQSFRADVIEQGSATSASSKSVAVGRQNFMHIL